MSQENSQAPADIDLMTRQGRSFSGNERNCCFLNTGRPGNAQFATVSALSGIDFPDDGRALAVVDWDQDGDLDVWVTNRSAPRIRLLINNSNSQNRSIQFRLVGDGSTVNRMAIGARVELETSEVGQDGQPVRLIKTMRAGEGFISQSSPWIHFGLADGVEIKSLKVRWPDKKGTVESFEVSAGGGRFELVQGSGKAKLAESMDRKLALVPSVLKMPVRDGQHRIPLLHQLPAPQLGYFDFEGKPIEFETNKSGPTLVNIWSSTCAPCLKELKEFSERHDELKAAGVKILAISVDELETCNPKSKADAADVVERFKMPFAAGMAPPAIMMELQSLHNLLIKMERPLPLPTSFLIDSDGKVQIIYKGKVDVDTLIADSKLADESLLRRLENAAVFPGTVMEDSLIRSPTEIDEAWTHVKMARELVARGRTRLAIKEYELALKRAPESDSVHNNLGNLYQVVNNPTRSIKHFRKALGISPDNPEIRVNLAQALVSSGNYRESEIQLEKVIQQNPKFVKAYVAKGLLLARTKKFEESRIWFEKALQQDPKNAAAHFNLGKHFEAKQDFEKAKMHFRQSLASAPNEPTVLSSLAGIYFRENNFDAAEQILVRAIGVQPENPDLHFQLGLVYQKTGQLQDAKRQFQATLDINPQHPGALSAIGRGGQTPNLPKSIR